MNAEQSRSAFVLPVRAVWSGELKWDERGLVPAVVQDAQSGQVLMQAYMNGESLRRTLETGETWFYSRSRGRLWHKGETSGHVQRVREIRTDCDGDCLLILVDQVGAACHEGDYSCFHYALPGSPEPAAGFALGGVLAEVHAVLLQRLQNPDPGSYTGKLFAAGPDSYLKKVAEEAAEVVLAVKNADRDNLCHEAADLIFHTLVALTAAGLGPADIARELAGRRGKRRPPKEGS